MEILHLNSMFSEPYLQNEFVNFKTGDECFKRFMPICHQFKEHQSVGIDIHLQKTTDSSSSVLLMQENGSFPSSFIASQ